jgi:ABC-2 type transport system permease protein
MNRSVVWRLIAKDLYLYRWLMVVSAIVGFAALPISGADGAVGNIGLVLMLTSMVALGIFIAMYGVLGEYQSKSLLFVLSLPVSPMQYVTAKIVASMIAFLIPWIALTGTIVGLTVAFDPPPDGGLPFAVALMVYLMASFCVLLALLLITGAELWAIAGILLTNLGVAAYMNVIPRLPGIAGLIDGPVAVWSPAILITLAIEAAVIVLSLALAFYIQSRKKDFV